MKPVGKAFFRGFPAALQFLLNSDRLPEVQLISIARADDDEKAHDNKNVFWEKFWKKVYEASANITLLLIIIHIGGVIVTSLICKKIG